MDSLFGIPMNDIMVVLLVLLGISLSAVAFVAWRNRVMFLIGVRNIPRRVAQTVLIIIGLMLSTTIISAAFTVGDTVDHSITKMVYDTTGHVDETVQVGDTLIGEGDNGGPVVRREAVPESLAADLEKRFQGDSEINGFLPVILEPVAAANPSTRQSAPLGVLTGLDASRLGAFPDIVDKKGNPVSVAALADDEILVNESMADELDVNPGDSVTFAVTVAGGVEPITYKWFKDGEAIAGATAASYTLSAVTGAAEAGAADANAVAAGATVRWAGNPSPIDNSGFTNPANAEGVPDGVFAVATTPAAFGPTAAYYLGFTAQTDLLPAQVRAINTVTLRVTYRSNSTKALWAVASFVGTSSGTLPDANIAGLGSSIYSLPLSSFPLADLSGSTATVDLLLPTEDLVIAPDLTPFFSDGTEGMTGEFRGRILITDGATILAPGPAGPFPLEIDSIEMLIDYDAYPGDGGVYRVDATDSATKATVSHNFFLRVLGEGETLPVSGLVGLGVLAGSVVLAGVLRRRKR
jgi:hypothetical protein